MKMTRTRIAAGIVVTVAAVALMSVGGVQATPAFSPGLSAGTSELEGIPAPVPLSDELTLQVEDLARFANTNPASALLNLRLVRSGLGANGTDIYVFRNDRDRPCVVVPDWISFCEPDSGAPTPGLDWSIGGGDPQTPSKFIAVYSDDVANVALNVDGRNVPVSMDSNLAYAEFQAGGHHAAFTAIRRDGGRNSVSLNLDG